MSHLALDPAVGKRPRTWAAARFKSIAALRTERRGARSIPLLSLSAARGVEDRGAHGAGRQAPSESPDNYWVVHPGDLVVNPMWVVEGGVAQSTLHGAVSPAYRVYRILPEAHGRYLHHLLRSQPYLDQYRLATRGITTFDRSVGKDDFHELPVLLPPLDEQRRIADFLDTETSRLDALQGLRGRQLSLLSERETSALTQILDDSTAARVRLGYLAALQTGVTVGGNRPAQGLVEYPYLRVANVKEDRLELDTVTTIRVTLAEARASLLRPGDVLMTEGGDLDKLGRGTVWRGEIQDCLHQNHVFALRCSGRLVPEYLAYFTRTASARTHFSQTGVKTTNLASTNSAKVRDLLVPLPDVSRQQELVRSAHRMLAHTLDLRTALLTQESAIRERRQALITAAVTGQFDVTTGHGGAA